MKTVVFLVCFIALNAAIPDEEDFPLHLDRSISSSEEGMQAFEILTYLIRLLAAATRTPATTTAATTTVPTTTVPTTTVPTTTVPTTNGTL
ncbi:hepatitis A virus cellular receptor 1 [Amia ocellicauda]|uniref:hepatitis A virus cellular receptor 1 n=1 Tax=Amia ocellicauda TaxID=2972642 RepID=UPI003464E0FA